MTLLVGSLYDFLTPFFWYILHRCPAGTNVEDCFAPLSAYDRRITELKQELAQTHGSESPLSRVSHVIITSDERNATFWDDVRGMGWRYVDHGREETSAKYGKW